MCTMAFVGLAGEAQVCPEQPMMVARCACTGERKVERGGDQVWV